jgi:hypothetical protein
VPAAEQETAAHPLPTPRQWKILAALDDVTQLDAAEQPLSELIASWTQKHAIEIQLDAKALADAGVGSDTPITRTLKGIRLRSALRLVLNDLDLTYLVGDGYLLITSKTEAENSLATKVYPVQDLVTLDGLFRAPREPGEKAGSDFSSLIELITSTIAPTTWDEVGGPGAIQGFAHSGALAISQTEEAHEEVAELLAALRRTRDKQLAAAKPVAAAALHRQSPDGGPLEIRVYHLVGRAGGQLQALAQGSQGGGAPDQAGAAPAPADKTAKDAANAPLRESIAVQKVMVESPSDGKLAAWAKAIAELVPQMIEPDSWAPSGKAMIRAVGETVVVLQTDEVQERIGKLVNEMLPGSAAGPARTFHAAVRLSPLSVQVGWPHEAEPLPGPVEAQIDKALDGTADMEFAEEPLAEVLSKLGEQHPVQIHLDHKALNDAGVGSDTPITRSIKGLSLRTALKLMLGELDLTYIIRNEVLTITSKTEAENMLTVKVYPVFDLVVRPLDAPATRPALDFQSLIENITSNVAPTKWDEVGGPGAIMPFTNSGALVISQTTEIHEEIAQFLRALREVGAEQEQGPK